MNSTFVILPFIIWILSVGIGICVLYLFIKALRIYESGEAFITFMSNQYAGIDDNVEKLFYKMKEFA